MRTGFWKRIACAACMSLIAAGAYRAAAAGLPSAEAQAPVRAAAAPEPLVRGERVLTFGGYVLNVAFTPGGRLVCFDITDETKRG
jgi:hypothetical protein